jgi:hypothetical protein
VVIAQEKKRKRREKISPFSCRWFFRWITEGFFIGFFILIALKNKSFLPELGLVGDHRRNGLLIASINARCTAWR